MAHAALVQGSVNQWNASYYNNANKRWTFGLLHLLPTALFFEANNVESKNDPDHPMELFIKFSLVSDIKKATSSLIYPSIAVVTKGKVTHWFSSLSNRNSVYLVIKHFFHPHSLTTSSEDDRDDQNFLESQSSQHSSKFGRELLQSVHDSHETLKTAASKLATQGHQLSEASCTMNEMNEDIDTATRITNGIDSWYGRLRVPKLFEQESIHVVRSRDIPYGFHFDVLCCEIQGLKYGLPKKRVLRLMKDGLTILDDKQKILHYYSWKNVSKLKIVSPWEVTVCQYVIGKPNICHTLTSIEMPKMLKEFEKFIPTKMEDINYVSVSDMSSLANSPAGQLYGRPNLAPSGMTQNAESELSVENRTSPSSEFAGNLENQQMDEKGMTNEEMNDLTSTLSTLKSLALDIRTEEETQLKTLDHLTDAVDKGNDKLRPINKKLNNILR